MDPAGVNLTTDGEIAWILTSLEGFRINDWLRVGGMVMSMRVDLLLLNKKWGLVQDLGRNWDATQGWLVAVLTLGGDGRLSLKDLRNKRNRAWDLGRCMSILGKKGITWLERRGTMGMLAM